MKELTERFFFKLLASMTLSLLMGCGVLTSSLSRQGGPQISFDVGPLEYNGANLQAQILISAYAADGKAMVGYSPSITAQNTTYSAGLWQKFKNIFVEAEALNTQITCTPTDTTGKGSCDFFVEVPSQNPQEIHLSLNEKTLSVVAYPAPALSSATPVSLSYLATTDVRMTGTQFREGMKVFIQETACSAVTVISSTEAHCMAGPSNVGGPYDITIKMPDLQEVVLPQSVSYVDMTPPDVQLTSLNAAGLFKGGSVQNITWVMTATDVSATPIKLQYSVNGGISWLLIEDNVANTGSYAWTLPSLNSNNVRVRVAAKDLSGNEGAAVSLMSFAVDSSSPLISLDNFNSGGVYKGGSQNTISWTATDANMISTPISLAYSTDGTTWSDIATGLANTGSYSWTIPVTLNSNNVRLKVTAADALGQSASAISDLPFAVDSTEPTLLLTSLLGGDMVGLGATRSITWSASDEHFGSTPIKIEYSSDGGTNWQSIVSVAANTGSYNWTVSVPVGTHYRIRITATDAVGNASVTASTSDFTVTDQAPNLTQTTLDSPYLSNGTVTQVTFGGACDMSASMNSQTDITITGPGISGSVTVPCTGSAPLGSWQYQVPAQLGDGSFVYNFSQTNQANLTTSISATWIRDITPPVISAVQINNGDPYIITTVAGVSVTAIDTATGNTGLKVRLVALDGNDSDCQASYQDDNWQSQTNPTMSYSVMISDNDVGDNATKKICVWAKDSVGNVTTISPTTGTQGQNMNTITYVNTSLPVIQSFSVSNAADGSANYNVGDLVKISWTATDSDLGLQNNPIQLEYTIDAGNTWQTIEQAYGGLSGNPKTYTYDYYGFNAPAGIFRVRIRAKNLAGLTSVALVSPTQNSSPWQVFAGTTDRGVGGSARGLLQMAGPGTRTHQMAIDPVSSDIYVVDSGNSGIVKIDARTGLTSYFIKYGTTTLGTDTYLTANSRAGGSVEALVFDKNRRLYLLAGGVNRTGTSASIYQIDVVTKKVSRYAGSDSAAGFDETATPSSIFVFASGMTFDEDSTLYFFTACQPRTTWNVNTMAGRLMKLTQNADGTPGALHNVAGNCTKGNPASNTDPMAQPLTTNGDPLYWDVAAWNHGNAIYYSTQANAVMKIINGTLYSTIWTNTDGLFYNNVTQTLFRVPIQSPTVLEENYPNTAGAGGETLKGYLVENDGTTNCDIDGTSADAACFNLFGTMSANSEGKMFFAIGAGSAPWRSAYVDSQNKVRIFSGTLPFSGFGGDKFLSRGAYSGIYYKKSIEPNFSAFPEGLYFVASGGVVFGKIEANGSVTQLAGNQSGKSIASSGTVLSPSVSLGGAGNSQAERFVFDDQGLPWMVVNNRLYSIDTSNKLVGRQTGSTYWDYAALTATASSTLSGPLGGMQNLTLKGSSAFYVGRYADSSGTYPLTNPVMRILDFAANTITQIMGTSSSGFSLDTASGVTGDVQSKSIDSTCYNGAACYLQFVENNSALTSDDQLYFAERANLRVISDPTTPANSTIKTLFTAANSLLIYNFIVSIDPVTLKADGKRIYYLGSDGHLRCHAVTLADESSICYNDPTKHIDLGPKTGMNSISRGPNQLTWKDAHTLLISGYNGEIYQYSIP